MREQTINRYVRAATPNRFGWTARTLDIATVTNMYTYKRMLQPMQPLLLQYLRHVWWTITTVPTMENYNYCNYCYCHCCCSCDYYQ